jgi:hypothetical protein
MAYRYEATERFWADFYALSDSQKESVRRAWKIFRQNPFDARLGTHKIHRLSAHYGVPITLLHRQRRVAPEKLAYCRQCEAVTVSVGEQTHLRERAHQAIERGRVHPYGSRDLLRRPRTIHELLGHFQLRGGGQRLGDELAGDEVHEHRGRR